jgi:hypothetical protein
MEDTDNTTKMKLENGKAVKKIDYKYKEDVYLNELMCYINNTYGEHYSKNKFQATEFIMDSGHGTGFCVGNVLKYAQRYGRKGAPEDWRKDMMKVIHYAMMQLHVHDNEFNKESK